MKKFMGCTIRQLPADKIIESACVACEINPLNRPAKGMLMHPLSIAVLTTKYWHSNPKLTVGFMETTTSDLQSKILSYMNLWGKRTGATFVLTNTDPQIRISRGKGGYWSYLGTDIQSVPANQQTMNLEGFVLKTPDSEYMRVIPHETGHTLGCPHEHMRPALVSRLDPTKTIAFFKSDQGWDEQQTRQQVLTPLGEDSLMGTPADEDSIMCYQISGSCTKDGKPIRGGVQINESDYAFMAKIYPPGPKKYTVTLSSDSPITQG